MLGDQNVNHIFHRGVNYLQRHYQPNNQEQNNPLGIIKAQAKPQRKLQNSGQAVEPKVTLIIKNMRETLKTGPKALKQRRRLHTLFIAQFPESCIPHPESYVFESAPRPID